MNAHTSSVPEATGDELLFVFGTLQSGHRNHHVNRGRRVPGRFVTVRARPLFLVGPNRLPWLLDRPDQGLPVEGEVYEVDAAMLAEMDRLERIADAGWYERRRIDVRRVDDPAAPPLRPWVYFGSEAGFAGKPVLEGPLPAYTLELSDRYPPIAP